MPQREHHRVQAADPQATADQDWQRLVEQRLPTDLEAQARLLKAFQRARGLPSALHLLRGLLYYVLSHSSLRDVSVWSRLIGLTSTLILNWTEHASLVALPCYKALRCHSTWACSPVATDVVGV